MLLNTLRLIIMKEYKYIPVIPFDEKWSSFFDQALILDMVPNSHDILLKTAHILLQTCQCV